MALLIQPCPIISFSTAEFDIFDDDTSKKIQAEFERDMEDAAKAIGELGHQAAVVDCSCSSALIFYSVDLGRVS